ncbi:peptide-methionine (S)-S-oxide reductase MsrA [Blastopirellula sp. JC732]|uniref:Peptide methionine sulfoxide reductase MsrA n=1 Tax=Blastopirellula sediminis TaxID=2894196 RepID=A0A9X1SGN2_9BACT|nr:peptide-methionine (S)-S-oxide reductase MsrA [Blastopirellula sediminis]MCC9607144.1 peptide-methionine (S)-S-oxide reductase MsrA [Blastopirellula sediminis]MCC9629563.1 peptide-methionine (S)-S-oxide reductase MsrA [Blastopirellula sediminis]
MAEATFGGGCFWCTEAIFARLNGVTHVEPGYSGGTTDNPTYEAVCRGTTGHAEVIRIEYNPEVVDFASLLEIFFQTHDPTTLNRQGADVGTQYRSVIFYHDAAQQEAAESFVKQLDSSGAFADPIITEISPLINYFPAEDYHRNYFSAHPNQSYCAAVIAPKVDKFRRKFAAKLKEGGG